MAFQQTDLDKLDAAIAGGVLQVTYADGRSVRYQTGADLLAARKMVAETIAGASATRPRRRVTVLRVGRCR